MQVLSNKKTAILIAGIFILFLPVFLHKGNVLTINPFLDKYLFQIGYPIGFIIPIALFSSEKFRDNLFSQIHSTFLRIVFIPMFWFVTPAFLPGYVSISAETITDVVSSRKHEEIVIVKSVDTRNFSGGRTIRSCNLSLVIYDVNRNKEKICVLPRFYGEPLSKPNEFFKKGDKVLITGRQSVFGVAIDELKVIHE